MSCMATSLGNLPIVETVWMSLTVSATRSDIILEHWKSSRVDLPGGGTSEEDILLGFGRLSKMKKGEGKKEGKEGRKEGRKRKGRKKKRKEKEGKERKERKEERRKERKERKEGKEERKEKKGTKKGRKGKERKERKGSNSLVCPFFFSSSSSSFPATLLVF